MNAMAQKTVTKPKPGTAKPATATT
jgi:hypothetical protein